LLIAATLAVFAQATHFGTVFIDDATYVSPPVDRGFSLAGLRFCLTTTRAGNWHPLTWLSLMLDGQVWGAWIGGWHLTSVLFHVLNVVLVLVLGRRLGASVPRAAVWAALFALHPLRAESVAWISERKDVLSGTFFLLTLIAYVSWVQRRSAASAAAVFCALAAGLLAKSMLVTTPFVLLLLDFWPLRRGEREGWFKLVLEKVPLLLLCLVLSVTAFITQAGAKAVSGLDTWPLTSRLGTAATAIPRYLWMTLWPAHLGPHYSLQHHWNWPLVAASGLAVICVSVAALVWRQRAPAIYVGWFWFLGMLVPTLGFVQVGAQALADRYTYLPHLGLFGAVVFSVPELGPRAARAAVAFTALVLAALGVRCFGQVASWERNQTLLAAAARADPEDTVGVIGRGVEADQRGDLELSFSLFQRAELAGPELAFVHYGLGQLLSRKHEDGLAAAEFAAAVRLEPSAIEIRQAWASALDRAGQLQEEAKVLRSLLEADPGQLRARVQLGMLLGRLGDDPGAARELARSADALAGDAELQLNAGIALARMGRYAAAVHYLEAAVALAPKLPGAAQSLEQARRDAAQPAR
jgi:hypothetical protein